MNKGLHIAEFTREERDSIRNPFVHGMMSAGRAVTDRISGVSDSVKRLAPIALVSFGIAGCGENCGNGCANVASQIIGNESIVDGVVEGLKGGGNNLVDGVSTVWNAGETLVTTPYNLLEDGLTPMTENEVNTMLTSTSLAGDRVSSICTVLTERLVYDSIEELGADSVKDEQIFNSIVRVCEAFNAPAACETYVKVDSDECETYVQDDEGNDTDECETYVKVDSYECEKIEDNSALDDLDIATLVSTIPGRPSGTHGLFVPGTDEADSQSDGSGDDLANAIASYQDSISSHCANAARGILGQQNTWDARIANSTNGVPIVGSRIARHIALGAGVLSSHPENSMDDISNAREYITYLCTEELTRDNFDGDVPIPGNFSTRLEAEEACDRATDRIVGEPRVGRGTWKLRDAVEDPQDGHGVSWDNPRITQARRQAADSIRGVCMALAMGVENLNTECDEPRLPNSNKNSAAAAHCEDGFDNQILGRDIIHPRYEDTDMNACRTTVRSHCNSIAGTARAIEWEQAQSGRSGGVRRER
jgi:hypothetical protein